LAHSYPEELLLAGLKLFVTLWRQRASGGPI
jgi:hypothetical protein